MKIEIHRLTEILQDQYEDETGENWYLETDSDTKIPTRQFIKWLELKMKERGIDES